MEQEEVMYMLSGSLYYASQMIDALGKELERDVMNFTMRDALLFAMDERACDYLSNPKNYTGGELLDETETLCELFVEFDGTNPLAFHVLEDVYFFTSEIYRGLSGARKMLYVMGYEDERANKVFDNCCTELLGFKRAE